MKLTTLRPRLQTAGNRLPTLTAKPGVIERKRGSAGVRDRANIRKRDQGMCQECKRNGKVSVGAAVDHITPLWMGGDDTAANKELLCQPCHDAKTAQETRERARS